MGREKCSGYGVSCLWRKDVAGLDGSGGWQGRSSTCAAGYQRLRLVVPKELGGRATVKLLALGRSRNVFTALVRLDKAPVRTWFVAVMVCEARQGTSLGYMDMSWTCSERSESRVL